MCRRCLNSEKIENMLMIHTPKCEQQEITTNKSSSEPHLQRKKHVQRNPLSFRICGDFESHNEFDNSNIGKKQLMFINKIHGVMVNYILSELGDVSEKVVFINLVWDILM